MRAIPTQYVKEGTILGENLYTATGQILLKSGTKLNAKLMDKVQSHKIFTVYIQDQHSDVEVNRLIEQSFRVKGVLLIKEIFDAARNNKSIMGLHEQLSKYTDDILYEIKSFRNNKIEYVDIKNIDNYLYSSALNVALISALMAWTLNYSDEMVKHIFLGAVYHDIGIALLPDPVIYKEEPLTLEEKMMILNHPINGHNFIKDKAFLSAYVKTITMTHHECLDASGYPKRIKGEEIHKTAQIVGLADIYDAMTSDRPYKRATSPKEAVEYIVSTSGIKYDRHLVGAFMNRVSPYPLGTIVMLSNGLPAVVDENNDVFPLRPKIRVIHKDGNQYNYESIDLESQTNITIESITYDLI
jgi:HD-GYP domain-containing protein (c-di-GMP phosphodiesterase class II)